MTTKSRILRFLKDPAKRTALVAAIAAIATAIGYEVSPEFADALRTVLAVIGAVS